MSVRTDAKQGTKRPSGRITRTFRSLVLLLACAALTLGCATSPDRPAPPSHTAAAGASRPIPVRNPSPKKTIAVARFDANGAFVASYGGYDIGGGLAAQLSSELSRSGSFVVVERAELSSVLREQEMALGGLTTPQTSPSAGNLLGAQLLVRGSVTEFSEANSGGGFSIGGPLGGGLNGGVSPRHRVGEVAMDLRVIDTTTGRVVATTTVRRRLSRTSLAVSGSHSNTSFGADGFQKTPLGQATREAISQAVVQLGQSLADVDWSARVAKVRGGAVYVNAGTNASLNPGDTLHVYRVVDRVVDPYTQEVLGIEEAQIGTLELDNVAPRYATGRFAGSYTPQVGDVLRYESASAHIAAN